MTRKPIDGDDHIIGYVAHTPRTCKHGPPKQTAGLPMGITDTCACGATTYVLRHKGNDGSNRPGKRWDYWEGERP